MEKMFSKELNHKNKRIEEANGLRRELVPYADQQGTTFKKYLLTEYDSKNLPQKSAYIISKEHIQKEYPLFKIKIDKRGIINFDKVNESNKQTGKLAIKYDEKYIDVSEPL